MKLNLLLLLKEPVGQKAFLARMQRVYMMGSELEQTEVPFSYHKKGKMLSHFRTSTESHRLPQPASRTSTNKSSSNASFSKGNECPECVKEVEY